MRVVKPPNLRSARLRASAIIGALRDDDNGNNSGSAYLFDASACPWDLDANGSIGVPDLLSLLGS